VPYGGRHDSGRETRPPSNRRTHAMTTTPYVLETAPKGTAKTSLEVTRRLASGRRLRAALTVQGPDVARRSQARFQEHLRPGDPEVDVRATLVAYDRQLAAAADALSDAEAQLYARNAELAALLEERRERQARLRAWMVGLRSTIDGQYVAPDHVGLGMEKHTARDVDGLVRQAGRTGQNLLSEGVASWLGEPLFPRSTFDPKVHGEDLLAEVGEMTQLQRRIEEMKRRRDEALLAKREAMAAFDQIHLRTARMFEELCRHAGKEELAERVRPAARRRTRRHADDGEDEMERSSDGVLVGPVRPILEDGLSADERRAREEQRRAFSPAESRKLPGAFRLGRLFGKRTG